MRLAGKRAFITAAGQGIGRAIAEHFVAEGADVTATSLSGNQLAGLKARTFALDVTDKAALQAAVREAAPDVLVNCAGFVHSGTVLEATDEEWEFAFRLNAKSHFHAIQAVVPGMLERGHGSIINIASVASSTKGFPNRFVYGATKGAVIGLTRAVARDYVTRGIRCNSISPGTVDSPSLHDRLRATGDYDTAMREFVARQPMGRLGQADEIAAVAVYLASDESAFTTGQDIRVDGGITM